MVRKDGFTLIELVVVIVILGLMVLLAVPRVVAQIEVAKAGEAMAMLGALQRASRDCLDLKNDDASLCDTWSELGVTAPAGSSLFTYNSRTTGVEIGFSAERTIGGTPNRICIATANTGDPVMGYRPLGGTYAGLVTRNPFYTPSQNCFAYGIDMATGT